LDIYLVDGTYELFRQHYALPSAPDEDGREVAAVRGVLASVLGMIKGGATHIAVATDHIFSRDFSAPVDEYVRRCAERDVRIVEPRI